MYTSTSRDHALNDMPTGCDSRNYLNPVIYSNGRQRKQTQFFAVESSHVSSEQTLVLTRRTVVGM